MSGRSERRRPTRAVDEIMRVMHGRGGPGIMAMGQIHATQCRTTQPAVEARSSPARPRHAPADFLLLKSHRPFGKPRTDVGKVRSHDLIEPVGIPLLIAGLVIPLFMMRGVFARNDIVAPCPVCGSEIKTTDATLQLDCPNCGKTLSVRDMKLYAKEE